MKPSLTTFLSRKQKSVHQRKFRNSLGTGNHHDSLLIRALCIYDLPIWNQKSNLSLLCITVHNPLYKCWANIKVSLLFTCCTPLDIRKTFIWVQGSYKIHYRGSPSSLETTAFWCSDIIFFHIIHLVQHTPPSHSL